MNAEIMKLINGALDQLPNENINSIKADKTIIGESNDKMLKCVYTIIIETMTPMNECVNVTFDDDNREVITFYPNLGDGQKYVLVEKE